MTLSSPIRSAVLASALSAVALLSCAPTAAQRHNLHSFHAAAFQQHKAGPTPAVPHQPAERSTLGPIQRHENPGPHAGVNGEHLAGWLDHHSNLTPSQQQQALEKEPGFHDLPPQTQQRMRDRLTQLNSMTPEQRSKIISRTEAMERLTPEQRSQVRDTMQQLAALPPASRRAVSRTFRTIRELPPDQRSAYLNSPDIRSQFSDQERSTLTNLMAVEPYIPAQPRANNDPNNQ